MTISREERARPCVRGMDSPTAAPKGERRVHPRAAPPPRAAAGGAARPREKRVLILIEEYDDNSKIVCF
jgi:hypothetical protein